MWIFLKAAFYFQNHATVVLQSMLFYVLLDKGSSFVHISYIKAWVVVISGSLTKSCFWL